VRWREAGCWKRLICFVALDRFHVNVLWVRLRSSVVARLASKSFWTAWRP